MPENPVTRVSEDGAVVEMTLDGLLVVVHIGRNKARITPRVEATNPSTGAVYSGYDVLPVTRRKATSIATAIYRGRQKRKEEAPRSRNA